ncbi:iron-sulfur protein [Clostridia bacterium]|nr:iron-sulfur protein [Clostridia bacterium]
MSKNIIFYFTGTGNSLYAAREIAATLGDTELAFTPDSFSVDLTGYERVGFVYPVYFGGIPLIVKKFVESLNIPTNVYLFAVATCGGSGRAGIAEIASLLSAKGRDLDFGSLLSMGGNYILLHDKTEKADSVNASASKELSAIVVDIRNKARRTSEKMHPIMGIIIDLFRQGFHKTARKYTVSGDCTACGLCSKICPVHNIEVKDSKPIFDDKCEQCMACIQFCPHRAINYRGKTQKRKRYHHPDITAADLIRHEKSMVNRT